MQIKNQIFVVITFALFQACQEYYTDPDIVNGDESIVIEGSITNDPGPYLIRISRTLAYNQTMKQAPYSIPVSDALVIISDNTGVLDTCLENESGHYYSSPAGIQGDIGKTYTLLVQTADGFTYQSEACKMAKPANLDSLYAETGEITILEKYETGGYFESLHSGVNLYLNASPAPDEEFYYKIETRVIKETAHLEWRNGRPETTPGRPPLPTQVYCWEISVLPNDKSLLSRSASESAAIRKRPIGFIMSDIHSESDEVNDPSYLVGTFAETTVISLPERIYEIYVQLNTQTNPANSIFDPIPTRIETNISCKNDPSRIVLGYFSASAVSRIIRYFEWTEEGVSSYNIDPSYNLPIRDDCVSELPPEFWLNP